MNFQFGNRDWLTAIFHQWAERKMTPNYSVCVCVNC